MKKLFIVFVIVFFVIVSVANSLANDDINYAREFIQKMPNNSEVLKLLEKAEEVKVIGSIIIIKTKETVYAFNVHCGLSGDILLYSLQDKEYSAEEKFLKEAVEHEKKEDYDMAAQLYMLAEMPARNGEIRKKMGEDFETKEEYANAGYQYFLAKLHEKSYEMFWTAAWKEEEKGNYSKAGDYYLRIGLEDNAKNMFALSAKEMEIKGNYKNAAWNYRSAGLKEKSEEMFEKFEEVSQTAEERAND